MRWYCYDAVCHAATKPRTPGASEWPRLTIINHPGGYNLYYDTESKLRTPIGSYDTLEEAAADAPRKLLTSKLELSSREEHYLESVLIEPDDFVQIQRPRSR